MSWAGTVRLYGFAAEEILETCLNKPDRRCKNVFVSSMNGVTAVLSEVAGWKE